MAHHPAARAWLSLFLPGPVERQLRGHADERRPGFSATVYGLGSGFFFLTYALLKIPSGILMPKIGARRWIVRIMVSWGLISASMMFIRTPLQFYIMRLLLGAAEAGFWPTCLFYLASWYPAAYRGRAISRFYCFFGVTGIVGGILSSWLLSLDGLGGLRGWQLLFLIEGLPTVALGAAMFWLLPDSPASARWLRDDERAWINQELAAENARLGAGKHRPFFTRCAIRWCCSSPPSLV